MAPFSPKGLAGFALIGFFLLSLAATGLGFADLRAANTDSGALSGVELGITIATTLFVVSAMVVALHNVVSFETPWPVRVLSFAAYLFFAVWTVGFGYGFFWKELAGQEFTEKQFEGAINGVAASMAHASGALATAEQATGEAASLAAQRAETEAREGRTCANHPNSTPGEGPLMRSRFAFADRAGNLQTEVRDRWIAPVAAQRARLELRVEALSRKAVPAGAANVDATEREVLEKLSAASRLPAAERRALFTSVHEEAQAFAQTSNSLRALNAAAFADRLTQLASEVGADPSRPGSADPARANDPGYCWDVVLNEKLVAAAGQLRAIEDVAAPSFEFLEGPKATRAAFFGLIDWMARLVGIQAPGRGFVFDDKAFLALFASIAVDLGIVFLTIVTAPRRPPRVGKASRGDGAPKPPRLSTILGSK